MAEDDPLSTVVTLLSTNYTNTNTDSITPTIAKIYEKPFDKEPTPGQDFIYVYAEVSPRQSVGIGNNAAAQVQEVVKIDIRSRPANTSQTAKISDTHARKVRAEVLRILYSNVTSPGGSFDNLDPNTIDITDLSNGSRGIFRYVIKVSLFDMARDMTA